MSRTRGSRQGLESISQMVAQLPPDQATVFLSLMTMEGRSFSPADVLEAVQINRGFSSALKFLSHNCPICQEQVSFSKVSHSFKAGQSEHKEPSDLFTLFPADHHNDALFLLPVSDVLQDVLHDNH